MSQPEPFRPGQSNAGARSHRCRRASSVPAEPTRSRPRSVVMPRVRRAATSRAPASRGAMPWCKIKEGALVFSRRTVQASPVADRPTVGEAPQPGRVAPEPNPIDACSSHPRPAARGTRAAGLAAIAYNFARMGRWCPGEGECSCCRHAGEVTVEGGPDAHGRLAAGTSQGGRMARACPSFHRRRRRGRRRLPAPNRDDPARVHEHEPTLTRRGWAAHPLAVLVARIRVPRIRGAPRRRQGARRRRPRAQRGRRMRRPMRPVRRPMRPVSRPMRRGGRWSR